MRLMVLSVLVVLVIAAGLAIGVFRRSSPTVVSPSSATLSLVAQADWLTDYPQALKRAGESHLPILADFTGSDWCGTCISLKKEVFDTPEFVTWAQKNVILLTVDFPNDAPQSEALKQQNLQLATTFKVDQFPTIIFLDASGKSVAQMSYVPGGPPAWITEADRKLGR